MCGRGNELELNSCGFLRPLVEPVFDDRMAIRQAGGSLQTGHLVVPGVRLGPLPERLALLIDFAETILGCRRQGTGERAIVGAASPSSRREAA